MSFKDVCKLQMGYNFVSLRNLVSFKDIRWNEYHIEIINEGNNEYLKIITCPPGKKVVVGKLLALSSYIIPILVQLNHML